MTDEQVFSAIQASTNAVFSTMLGMEVLAGEPCRQEDPPPLNGVMALLGFTGEWVGTGLLYCHERLACRISSAMLMTEISEITNEVLDGMGELGNMVMGNVKDQLQPVVGALAMSIPTVIYGRNFQTRTTQHRNWFIVPFCVADESFEIRLCLTKK